MEAENPLWRPLKGAAERHCFPSFDINRKITELLSDFSNLQYYKFYERKFFTGRVPVVSVLLRSFMIAYMGNRQSAKISHLLCALKVFYLPL